MPRMTGSACANIDSSPVKPRANSMRTDAPSRKFSFVVSGIFRFFVMYWVKPVRFREGLNSFSIFFTSQLILLGSITQWKRLSYDGYVYPDWAQAVAWLLALCSFVAIPVRAITEIVHHKGSFREVRSKLFLYYLFQYIIHSKHFSVPDWLKFPDKIWTGKCWEVRSFPK